MTQEDKELLLKDLCARLPYRVIVKHPYGFGELESIIKEDCGYDLTFKTPDDNYYTLDKNIKPYLRPMSSFTDEEYDQLYLDSRVKEDTDDILDALANDIDAIDWLNAHHFDYRGLIEKGLALEAPEGMYELNK